MKIVIFTLGCKVNQYESDSLALSLQNEGHEVSTSLEVADLYILNTCAVTLESEKKSRQVLAKIKKLNEKAKVIVMGCASENNPDQFLDRDNVQAVLGVGGKHLIPQLLNKEGNLTVPLPSEYENNFFAGLTKTRATLKVQDGCDNFCAYCLIPYLRGRSRSRDLNSIIEEATELAKHTNEIVITGINTSDYKINGKLALSVLMAEMGKIDARIRISSLEANIITDDFLKVLKEVPNFAPHFHLSLQSGSDEVLKAMNRKYSVKEYLDKVKLIRKYFQNAAITTDLIVGFSTETDKNFKETLKTLKRAKFFDIHVFPYSKRKGTKAYELKELAPEIIKARVQEALKVKQRSIDDYIKKSLGTMQTVLIEEEYDGYLRGHTEYFIKVYIPLNNKITSGEFVKVKLIERFKDGALAQIIEEEK
ncbi:MAG: tRNA (N(6)-L-threonylcarbamoyladenosine(37)-C(2))-methylthiotransferase MtaB [Spirochaetales bacterium]